MTIHHQAFSQLKESKGSILVIGDLMLDRYWYGEAERISPEAPVPVVHIAENAECPGGAANVALNCKALGASVCLMGVVGQDAVGDRLIHLLQTSQLNTKIKRQSQVETISKLRIISQHQQLLRLDFEQKCPPLQSLFSFDEIREEIVKASVVILSDYGKGTLSQCLPIIQLARELAVPVLVDPKSRDFSRYAGATLITPNLHEFEAVVGNCSTEQDIEDRARDLLINQALQGLLVTRGAKGMTLVTHQQTIHLPTHALEVFDVTGAGDTVIAAMAASLAADLSYLDAMAVANTAAGIIVGKLGAATVSLSELALHLAQQSRPTLGVVEESQLLTELQFAKTRQETIVMTNGCFDILHAGHVQYLQQAKALGQRLIVAVNDDASVVRLKGTTRPLVPLEQRMQVLAGLAAVDWVLPFSEDTPLRLIHALNPDILVKGGDYQREEIVGFSHVSSYGGSVIILDFVEGCSTTQIVKRMKEPTGICV